MIHKQRNIMLSTSSDDYDTDDSTHTQQKKKQTNKKNQIRICHLINQSRIFYKKNEYQNTHTYITKIFNNNNNGPSQNKCILFSPFSFLFFYFFFKLRIYISTCMKKYHSFFCHFFSSFLSLIAVHILFSCLFFFNNFFF